MTSWNNACFRPSAHNVAISATRPNLMTTSTVAIAERSLGRRPLSGPNAIVYEIPPCAREMANMINTTAASQRPRDRKNAIMIGSGERPANRSLFTAENALDPGDDLVPQHLLDIDLEAHGKNRIGLSVDVRRIVELRVVFDVAGPRIFDVGQCSLRIREVDRRLGKTDVEKLAGVPSGGPGEVGR